MGSMNDEPQSWRNDQVIPNQLEADIDVERGAVRAAVAHGFL